MLSGATRLYSDFLNAHANVATYFGPLFDDHPALAALAQRLKAGEHPREQLAQALSVFADEACAPDAAKAQLDILRRPGSMVVFAGQQAGLFTGPLYAVYKALTVERWAADLSSLLALPVIPCYWLASDDHDLAEVDHIGVPGGAGVATVKYSSPAIRAGEPIERIVLDSGIDTVIKDLADCLPRSSFAEGVFGTLKDCYFPGTPFSSAFARLWYRMFPHSKLLFVSPAHPELRKAAAPVLQRAVREDARLFSIYAETSAQLEAAGYHRQVHKSSTQTLLFHQRGKRRGIHRGNGNGSFVWEGAETVTAEWLCEAICRRPEDFSPNVLLRPIVQNAMFPTLGVVLGPAETAYYAQLGGLHDHFGVPRPAVMPRTSVTILEQTVAKRVSRLGIDLAALSADPDGEVSRVLQASFPKDLGIKLEGAAKRVDAAFDELRADVHEFDPSLDGAVRLARKRAGEQMSLIARKMRAAHRHREKETETQIRSVAQRLFPGGKAQERTINIVYYWARLGSMFLGELYRHWPAGRRDHLIWEPR